jgi:hypothetical protein
MFVCEVPLLDARFVVPIELTVGETIEMEIRTSNPYPSSVTLDSIDIDAAFLGSFQVLAVAPELTGTEMIPLLDQRSWRFDQSVPAAQKLILRFTLPTIEAGHFVGNVDV